MNDLLTELTTETDAAIELSMLVKLLRECDVEEEARMCYELTLQRCTEGLQQAIENYEARLDEEIDFQLDTNVMFGLFKAKELLND